MAYCSGISLLVNNTSGLLWQVENNKLNNSNKEGATRVFIKMVCSGLLHFVDLDNYCIEISPAMLVFIHRTISFRLKPSKFEEFQPFEEPNADKFVKFI